eukprot:scaffold100019_cov80-Phaeocystis_antarctica.AAC.7
MSNSSSSPSWSSSSTSAAGTKRPRWSAKARGGRGASAPSSNGASGASGASGGGGIGSLAAAAASDVLRSALGGTIVREPPPVRAVAAARACRFVAGTARSAARCAAGRAQAS